MKQTKVLLTLWLTIAATGVWAEVSPETVADNISAGEQVQMSDGRTVKAMQVPRRASDEDYTYTYKGVKYTYISENNYTSFFNTSVHTPETYGWYKDNDGWFINAEGAYITAASIDEESVPEDGEVYILNDLVGYFTSHTHLGCVADQGFTGESKVKRIYFQDANAQAYNANSEFHFFIGHKAFANAPHLEKVDLMQYTTKGTNHWEAMPANRVKSIWDNAFEGSPNAMIRVATSVIDDYRNSSVWAHHKDRIISYEPSGYEIMEYGARYKCMLAQDGKTYLTNDGPYRERVMEQLRLWNADYQSFNAGSLLAPSDNGATVYYTTIEGNDADYLKSHDGVLKVYNDIGSYYNYKTIAIRRNAFLNCDDLKAVEFWQTNGRSENSYSDLKIVIENGAFRKCKNLKEIRLYYYAQDGEDRWQVLGPEDVIPGDDIFGIPSPEELENMTEEQQKEELSAINRDFRILVSPSRYLDFLSDPNWALYAGFIKAADFEPTNKKPIEKDGLTYEYMSTGNGILSTTNVVSQNWSWWSIPVLAAEAAMIAYSGYQITKSIKESIAASAASMANAAQKGGQIMTESQITAFTSSVYNLGRCGVENATAAECAAIAGVNLKSLGVPRLVVHTLYDFGICSPEGIVYSFTPELLKSGIVAPFATISTPDILLECFTTLNNSLIGLTISSYEGSSILSAGLATEIAKFAGITGLNMGAALTAARLLGDDYNGDKFRRGLVANNRSYIHAVSVTGVGLNMVYTPSKNMVYHQYISKADPNLTTANIYAGADDDTRTMTFRKSVFAGNTNLVDVRFHEAKGSTTKESVPMLITIPDSAFAGCSNLARFDLRLYTGDRPTQSLGPENFILCGDSIFAGCDSTKLKIIIPKDRKQDFLDDVMWQRYKRYFAYEDTEYPGGFLDYGVNYAYAYEGNTTKKVSMRNGHKVEHLVAWQADNDWLGSHKGQLGLFNDIGIYNSYKLDYVKKEAFRGNQNLKGVSCWDIKGWAWGGDIYYDFSVALQDSCFADCPNLEAFDLLYLCTDGINTVRELRPSQLPLGSGVFNNTPKLMLKMTQQQQRWFEADTKWAEYKDRFAPCLVKPVDKGVKKALKDLRYTTSVGSPSTWDDIIDMSKLKDKGFEWLNGKLAVNNDIKLFPEFKQFEWAGLDFIGGSWFVNDYNLTAIELPSTIKKIGGYAFQNCDLREIEIPAAVTQIDEMAFNGNANMKVIRCLGTTPAALGTAPFEKPEGLKIYVPAEAVNAYKEKWSDYKDYIVAASDAQTFPKSVTTTEVGQLAQKLGLETIMSGDFLTGLKGAYWNIDSLTVSGPLNGVDVGVLRFLGGADVNNSDPTYGRLRYLNLYNARLKKDKDHPYQCHGVNDFIDNDDVVDEYMFYYCNKLEKVILPKEATYIGEHVFDNATSLKHLAVGDKTTGYDDRVTYETTGLDELVFLTTQKAASDATKGWRWNFDSWEVPISMVYCRKNLVGAYANEPALTQWMQGIVAPFADDRVLEAFVAKGYFFPSEYLKLANIDGILAGSGVTTFDELRNFRAMGDLGSAFANCDQLRRITLPDTLRTMGYSAFKGCSKLDSIYIYADSVPAIESGTFRDLPSSFKIYVPKTLAKLYRTKWAEYADHIVGDNSAAWSDLIEITTTGYGQVAEKLGLTTERKLYSNGQTKYVRGIYGEYSHIRRLKINGPISGEDFAVLRYLGGYCGWSDSHNVMAPLEYLDLYDAQVVKSDAIIAEDRWFATDDKVKEDNVLPPFALRRAYALKTLILPKTLKKIATRSLMECEYLETVVIGDDVETINWDAFDDDVALTRMYILAKQKPKMDTDVFFWRWMCNNYNPTFDAFYVRPSLYKDYIADGDYTGSSWQRTNNISTGAFKDDESFAAFAAHAAATKDDLVGVGDVSGWFANRTGIKDLTPLRYTLVDSLKAADMKPLTKLERIAMPMTLAGIEDGAFADAKNLRWADMMLCDSTALMTDLQNGGLRKKGLTENTLCYLPAAYGQTDEVNVVVGDTTSVMNCANYRLIDGLDYDVPYKFNAKKVENTRTLTKSAAPYTICLPYDLQIPNGAKAYKLSGRSSNELIFTETTETLQALQPYLIWTTSGDASLNAGAVEIPANGGNTFGKQDDAPGFSMRGTLYGISNAEAADLGAYTLQQDGKWHPVMSDTDNHRAARILPFRAYLLQNRVAGARAIGMTLEDVTGIEQLRTIDSNGTERIYDLNGRQLSAPTTGINIINGKKVIKR